MLGWFVVLASFCPRTTLWLRAVGSAKRTSSGGRTRRRRERAAFFTAPSDVAQRRYEALRAYFVEGAWAAQAKLAAREEVLRLRAAGHSVTEIAQALAVTDTPLNRTGVWELLVAE